MATLKMWRAALNALAAIGVGILGFGALPAAAQVDWVTTLNATQVPVALAQQTVAGVAATNVAQTRAEANIAQSDYLMPRAAQSAPSGWWSKTQTVPTGARAADAVNARTAVPTPTPITSDGGHSVANANLADRLKK
jgi:hypothetical protein